MTTALSPHRRSAEKASSGRLIGSPVVYDQRTRIATPFGAFDEVIAPGALRPALASGVAERIALVRDHDPSLLLARHGSGTLTLLDRPLSLDMRASVVDSELGRETIELVRRGDLRGMSFSFVIEEDSWHEQDGTTIPLRVIEKVSDIYDVAVVTFPAYTQTTIDLDTHRSRSSDFLRMRFGHRIASSGGLMRYGRPAVVDAELRRWCRYHRLLRGTQHLPDTRTRP